jgi:hypothetical protein
MKNGKKTDNHRNEPEAWHVLVCGLPLADDSFDLGSSVTISRLFFPLSVFDLAALGAAGFREWATLEPLAPAATAEIVSNTNAAVLPGYNALNKCWLASAILVLRGFAHHICPAVSSYSWNLIAGHQKQTSHLFTQQLKEEGIKKAIHKSRRALPAFDGALLDYHLKILIPEKIRRDAFSSTEADWVARHFEIFNRLASESERFRFALEASIDWRYSKDARSALARIWSGIESLFNINTELVYRISLLAATVLAPRGKERTNAFRNIKNLYGIRSKAVHGEPLTEDKLLQALYGSFELLRHLILDAITLGRVRSEDDFISELLC